MDKVVSVVSAVFLIILIIFAATAGYGLFVEEKYRTSLVSTYSYTLTISASEPLTNVTFFIPLPANLNGNSPIVEQFSIRAVTGLPASWDTTLLGSDQGTMVKIRMPLFPSGGGATLSADSRTGRVIDTRSPRENDIVLRPVQGMTKAECAAPGISDPGTSCYRYKSPVYADYDASPAAEVRISSTFTGKNAWNIFRPASNQYSNSIAVVIHGAHHGWVLAQGELQTGTGSYDVPAI